MTTQAARFDLFGPIHKAIRCALADLLTQMGTTTFADPGEASRIAARLEEVTELCEDHRRVEDRTILPALAERLHGALEGVRGAHESQPTVVAELRALAETLQSARDADRVVVGRTLYLHFSTFAAELFLHMAEEELVLRPLLEKLFSDDELRAVHARVQSSLTMPEKLRALPWMLRATTAGERATLVRGVAATSPPEVVEGLLGVARSVLSEAAYGDLTDRVAYEGGAR